MPARKTDPLVGFHYGVEIQGVVKGYFTECSGLGSEHEVIEHKVIDEKGREIIQKIPGRLKWQDITLKRGITDAMDIWDWRKKVEDGDREWARHNGAIKKCDQNSQDGARWDFGRVWQVKVKGAEVEADE